MHSEDEGRVRDTDHCLKLEHLQKDESSTTIFKRQNRRNWVKKRERSDYTQVY